jgi:hypothetical protein
MEKTHPSDNVCHSRWKYTLPFRLRVRTLSSLLFSLGLPLLLDAEGVRRAVLSCQSSMEEGEALISLHKDRHMVKAFRDTRERKSWDS